MLQNTRRSPVSDGPLVHSLYPESYFFFLTVFFLAAFFFAIAVYLHVTQTES